MVKSVKFSPFQFFFPAVCTLAILVTGCAGSKASYRTVTPMSQDENLGRFTKLVVETKSNSDISLTSSDRERIANWVVRKVKEKAPSRFAEFNSPNMDSGTLYVTVNVTRYDEGNAFARAMLAGLGQIHIEADVLLEDRAKQTHLSRYAVDKTFAWGGIYGGVTRITDVEEGFGEAVAAVILGEPPE